MNILLEEVVTLLEMVVVVVSLLEVVVVVVSLLGVVVVVVSLMEVLLAVISLLGVMVVAMYKILIHVYLCKNSYIITAGVETEKKGHL